MVSRPAAGERKGPHRLSTVGPLPWRSHTGVESEAPLVVDGAKLHPAHVGERLVKHQRAHQRESRCISRYIERLSLDLEVLAGLPHDHDGAHRTCRLVARDVQLQGEARIVPWQRDVLTDRVLHWLGWVSVHGVAASKPLDGGGSARPSSLQMRRNRAKSQALTCPFLCAYDGRLRPQESWSSVALQIPNNYGVMTFHWTFTPLGRQMSCTCGFRDVSVTNDVVAAVADWRTKFVAIGSPGNAGSMDTRWQMTSISALMRTNAGFLVTAANVSTVIGSVTAPTNDQPIYSPWVVSKLTAFAGRQFRGRMYPPMTIQDESTVDAGGTITPAVVVAYQSLWTQFLTTVNGGSFTPQLLHEDVGLATPAPNAIASLFVRPVVGQQRRRRTRGA